MKIALVVPTFPKLSETFIVTKALGLVDSGHDVRIICSSSREGSWSQFGPRHRVHQLRTRVHLQPELSRHFAGARRAGESVFTAAWNAPHRTRAALAETVQHLGRHALRAFPADAPLIGMNPDVVHFEFGALAPPRMHLATTLGCPVTVSFRGYDINYAGLDAPDYYEPVWRHAAAVHVLSNALWKQALARGATPSLNHSIIPPAIDTTEFTPRDDLRPAVTTTLRLVSVGRLHWTKGYEYALEAMARLRRAGLDFRYEVIGDGPYLEAVAFWRHQLGLDDVVTLRRSLSPEEVRTALSTSDIFLHAAVSEGFGNAPLEAQAMGVPVVCTDAGGLPENVKHGETGLVVPRRDPAALASALIELAADPTRRAALGRGGIARVRTEFGAEQHIDRWVSFYEKVAS